MCISGIDKYISAKFIPQFQLSLIFIHQHLENNAKQRVSRYSSRSTFHFIILIQFNDEETMAKMEMAGSTFRQSLIQYQKRSVIRSNKIQAEGI